MRHPYFGTPFINTLEDFYQPLKTNTMKKEELYGKQIHAPTPEISERVQKKLFEMGFYWNTGDQKVFASVNRPYLIPLKFTDTSRINHSGHDFICHSRGDAHRETIQYWEFLEEAPEKWCIRRTAANHNTINDWARAHSGENFANGSGFVYVGDSKASTLDKWGECTELTFDQFKKYVLREPSKISTFSETACDYITCNAHGENNFAAKIAREIPDRYSEKKTLPTYWVVKNDGSQRFKDTVIKHLNEIENVGLDGRCGGSYYGFDGKVDMWTNLKNFRNSPAVLTLDEFIEMTQPDRRIIGYKAPTDMWGGKLNAGEIYTRYNETMYWPQRLSLSYSLPQELVEQWEPVYEEERTSVELHSMGSNNITVTVHKDGRITYGTSCLSVQEIAEKAPKANLIHNKISGYEAAIDRTARFIRIGCKSANHLFSISELELAVEAHKNLQ